MDNDRSTRAKALRDSLFRTPQGGADEPMLPVEKEIAALNADYAFGDVWSRPGLPLRTRSLLTVGVLTALYRGDQLRLHVNAALNNGVTPEEIFEVIFHVGAYAGIPTANSARLI